MGIGAGTAILLGSAVGAGTTLLASKGASEASRAQRHGADEATQAQLEMFYQQREDLAPWRKAGEFALGEITGALTDPNALTRMVKGSPGYKFRLAEGEKAIERSAAAKGSLFSGATGKALTRYGQDYASGETQNYLNRLFSMAGLAQGPVQTGAGAATATGSNLANINLWRGNALATGRQNMYGIGAGALYGAGQNVLDYLMYKKYLDGGGDQSAYSGPWARD